MESQRVRRTQLSNFTFTFIRMKIVRIKEMTNTHHPLWNGENFISLKSIWKSSTLGEKNWRKMALIWEGEQALGKSHFHLQTWSPDHNWVSGLLYLTSPNLDHWWFGRSAGQPLKEVTGCTNRLNPSRDTFSHFSYICHMLAGSPDTEHVLSLLSKVLKSMARLLICEHSYRLSLSIFTFMHWRRKWQPTPVFLLGESQGWGSLLGCCLWGRTEWDTTEAT